MTREKLRHGGGFMHQERVRTGRRHVAAAHAAKRGEVKGFSRASQHRFMDALAAGLPARRKWLFCVYTLGPDFQEHDFHASTFQFLRWLGRRGPGYVGYWFVEEQKRGALHLHLLLDASMGDGSDATAWWLERTKDTGSLPAGQYVAPLKSDVAAARYSTNLLAESVKGAQKDGWQGRRWGYVNRPAVLAMSLPVERLPASVDLPIKATHLARLLSGMKVLDRSLARLVQNVLAGRYIKRVLGPLHDGRLRLGWVGVTDGGAPYLQLAYRGRRAVSPVMIADAVQFDAAGRYFWPAGFTPVSELRAFDDDDGVQHVEMPSFVVRDAHLTMRYVVEYGLHGDVVLERFPYRRVDRDTGEVIEDWVVQSVRRLIERLAASGGGPVWVYPNAVDADLGYAN